MLDSCVSESVWHRLGHIAGWLITSANTRDSLALISLSCSVTQKVFLDISIGGNPVGRIVLGMYGNYAPKTVANFVAFGKSMQPSPFWLTCQAACFTHNADCIVKMWRQHHLCSAQMCSAQ